MLGKGVTQTAIDRKISAAKTIISKMRIKNIR